MGTTLKESGYNYVAVDFSEEMIAECDKDFETHVAELTRLPFRNNEFDLVMCLHVIRHNNPEEYEQIVGELCRVSNKYVLILNPFVEKEEDVKQIFERPIFDIPMTYVQLHNLMAIGGFTKIFADISLGDYKDMDSFILFERKVADNGAVPTTGNAIPTIDETEDNQDEGHYKVIPGAENDDTPTKEQVMKAWQFLQTAYERRSHKPRATSYLTFIRNVATHFKDTVGVRDGFTLDIGCGNGLFAGESYEKRGQVYIDPKNTIIGLDPLESTETRFPVVRAMGEDIPFQDTFFSTVVIASALDHVTDPVQVLIEARRILKDDGKIFIWNSIVKEGETNPYHLFSWTQDELLEMIGSVFTVAQYAVSGHDEGGYNLLVEGDCK